MKHLKRNMYVMIVALVVMSGLVFANREIKPSPKPLSIAEKQARIAEDRKKWEVSPDGLKYSAWRFSNEGKNINASHDKIRKYIEDFSNMEATITSLTFQRTNGKSAEPNWLIVKIEGETYMMQFNPKEFQQLNNLKVNDKIIVRSHSAGYSHHHPYLIVSGDYIEQDNKVLFERDFSKSDRC